MINFIKKIFKLSNKNKKENLIIEKEEKEKEEILNFIESLDLEDDFKLNSTKIYKDLINQPVLHNKLMEKMETFFGYKYYRTMEELLEDYVLDDWEIIKNIRMNKFNENNSNIKVENRLDIINKFELASELYLLPVKTKLKKNIKQKHALGMLYPTPIASNFFVDNNQYFFISLDIAYIIWGTKSLSFLENTNKKEENLEINKQGSKDVYKILNFMESNNLSDLSFYQYDKNFYTFRGIKNLQNEVFTNQVPINKTQQIIDSILIQINEDTKTKKPSIAGRIKLILETGVERSFRLRLTRQTKGSRGALELPRMVSIRKLAGVDMIHNIESLGYDPDTINIIKEALTFKNGLIIISGPTGKGKTTLLYAILYYLNKKLGREIICIHQDTIEIEIDGFRQIDLSEYQNAKGDNYMGIEETIANILQQKPDVTLIDEVKRPNEMQKLIDLANKGHTTFTTMHTNDCASALSVLENTGKVPKDFYVQSVKLIINQDLVKKKCQSCNGTGLDSLNLSNNNNKDNKDNKCEVCDGTGVNGVLPVYELAFFKDVTAKDDPAINFYDLIKKGKIFHISKEQIAKKYLEKGLITEKDYITFSNYNVDNIEKIFKEKFNNQESDIIDIKSKGKTNEK